jgi:hypothetical protein
MLVVNCTTSLLVKLVPVSLAVVFHPVNVYPVRVKVFVVNTAEAFKVSVSGAIVPIPPFALNVMVAVVDGAVATVHCA